MIVYQSTKSDFVEVATKRDIEAVILEAFEARMGRRVAPNEVRSWKESLQAMSKVLNDDAIPDDASVAVEYGIPQTSKRVDMLLSGRDAAGQANLIIIELKWSRRRGMRDLNEMVDAGSGMAGQVVLGAAVGVNDFGGIAVIGFVPGEESQRGFLALPRRQPHKACP